MLRRIKVYIAGPLNGMAVDYIQNLHRMTKRALQAHSLGASPYVPGSDFLLGLLHGRWAYEDYFSMSQAWLAVSDVVWAEGQERSHGTTREVKLANSLNIPVVYSLTDLQRWISCHEAKARLAKMV